MPARDRPGFLQELEDALRQGDVRTGFRLLEESPGIEERIREAREAREAGPAAIEMLLALARWVDLGYRDTRFLARCHQPFAAAERGDLRFLEVLRLDLVEAFLAFSVEDLDRAIEMLETVVRAGRHTLPPDLTFAAHFWRGRAHRKRGEYDTALLHISEARRAAEAGAAPRLVAMATIHESWLLFQRGERREALLLLDQAEQQLRETGNALALGNIESARGRIVRRAGEYAGALKHFERAVEIYSEGFADHPNCARALVNAAYVKRLIALGMLNRRSGGPAKGALHARYLAICREALDLLATAGSIYAQHGIQTGSGAVLVNAGHLHLESGDLARAAGEAGKAYALGEQKHDSILMARARILQSAVGLAHAEEDLEDDPGADAHAVLAVQHAEEAIELAVHTQNKRLLAAAYLARGTAAASDILEDFEAARSFAARAGELLGQDDRDHLLQELGALKTRLLHAIGIDHTLRLWSDGDLGNKPFQQIQEEFAEIVIPKVWLRQGRNITRVAQQLSISPKKVRRILRNAEAGHR